MAADRKTNMEIGIRWDGGTTYSVTTPSDARVTLDSDAQAGPSPMEALLAALAGCMAIDIVMILQRMRAEPDRLTGRVAGTRRDEHPRSFDQVTLEFEAEGAAVTPERLDRAVALSFDKYCSVLHSLNRETRFAWTARLAGEPVAG